MIYLIDDKKLRQEKDFGWSSEKLAKYKDYILPIYTLDELQNRAKEIFQEENKVFYHESFLDNSIQNEESVIKRMSLEEFAKKHKTFQLVIFSGSKNSRVIKKNIAHLPVAVVYQNLQLFLELNKESQPKLEHLVYGANPEIENELLNKLEKSLSEIEQQPVEINNQSCYFIPSFDKFIPNPIRNTTIAKFFDQEDDLGISNFINENLSHIKFDTIFIPLCYGNSLSDYNGLRLATHIRCTSNSNQLSRIIIYGFVGIEYLLQNGYFNILKTKNVFLVPFSKQALANAANIPPTPLTIEELPNQIEKLKLVVPQNYEDNHSMVNEWAIYRWATTINTEDDAIEKITQKIKNNLYFKYLQTIFPISINDRLHEDNLKIQTNGNPKILYIDDEAEKGWYEIFCKIFYDVNKLDFEYLGGDFKNQTETQIIDCCLKKVKDYDADIVILDFRLHQNDFNNKDITKITSLEILTNIKKYNPGIQVIIFSATNKVWNLQALQNEGADNFIIKESPDLSSDEYLTVASILNLKKIISESSDYIFLKEFYFNQFEIIKDLIPRRNKKNERPLPKEFVDEAIKWLEVSNGLLNKGGLGNSEVASSFILKFAVLESISNRIINIDNPIEIERNDQKKYKFEFRSSEKRLRNFVEDDNNKGFYRRTNKIYESNRNLPWVIKILNTIDFITEESISEDLLKGIIKKRNDLIHANPTTGDKINIEIKDLIFINDIIIKGLKNIV
jgi:DNA-binding NarL/FixJ family response regulator